MLAATVDPAHVSFRNQIASARGMCVLGIASIERGERKYDDHGVDITDDCLADLRRKVCLADGILNAPPLTPSEVEALRHASPVITVDFGDEDGLN